MGMFDSVFVPCPICKKLIEFQSKAGECNLKKYHYTSVPANIAMDIKSKDYDGKPYDVITCCEKQFYLSATIERVSMNIKEWIEDEEDDWD